EVVAGQRASVTVALRRTSPRAGTQLSVSGLPAGAGGTFSPRHTTGPRSTLAIATDPNLTPGGVWTLRVTGRRGTRRATTTFRLRVLAPNTTPFVVHAAADGLAPGMARTLNL